MYDRENPHNPAQDQPRRIPPETSRQDALGRLQRERWHAQQAGELGRVAEIDSQIRRLSARSAPASPTRETTSASTPRERRATPKRK